jgi:hypothetical protein
MLETNAHVPHLFNKVSNTFDIVDHAVSLEKLNKLQLPTYCFNWLKAFLTGTTNTTDNSHSASIQLTNHCSVIQGLVSVPLCTLSWRVIQIPNSSLTFFPNMLMIQIY